MEKRSISIVLYSARSVEKKTLLRLLMIGYKKKKIKQNRKDLMFARLAECSHIFFLNNTMFVFLTRAIDFTRNERLLVG